MYTIRQASIRSGVDASLLRAWERRYGVVSPQRTPGGYRLYDDAAVDRLRAMRQLVDAGWPASRAAEAVLNGELAATTEAAAGEAEPAPASGPADFDVDALVSAAAVYDPVAVETALDGLFSRGSFESVIDDLVLPAVAALGTAWAAGRIDVAAEHLASAAVQRRLAALFDLGGAAGGGAAVVVGLPPGCRHEIGTIAFAVALRRRGVEVLYLGPDVPVASWLHIVAESRPFAAVVGVIQPADVSPAREVLAALGSAAPDVVLAAGGAAAEAAALRLARALPRRVTDAAVEVAALRPGR
jgi:methanogenic corrinoid protein MtbC1